MNYYSFHIGDYAAHTQRLSPIEDLAYRRMIDAYYLAERPFNGCSTDVAREIGLHDFIKEVEYILSKFFVQVDGYWTNSRCDIEIAKYHDKQIKASNAGKASAQHRLNVRSTSVGETSTSVEDSATDVQPTKNQEPITNNQEPISPKPPSGADMQFESFWSAYPKRVGKDAARKAFEKRKPDSMLVELMLNAIEAQSKLKQWTDEGGKYIPNPATWLNEGRWKDETKPVALKNSDWWSVGGFASQEEARNFCSPSTVHQFRDGKRLEVA